MTLKNEYTLMKCFTNKCKMDCYIRSQLGYIVTSHSNKYVCNIKDCIEEDEHKMQIHIFIFLNWCILNMCKAFLEDITNNILVIRYN